MKTQTFCSCCHELITEEVVRTDAYNDGEEADYCSWECVEHVQEQHQEYLDSYDV